MSQTLLQAQALIGSILELLSDKPELVSSLNLTLKEDREILKASCDISDKEAMAAKLVPYLTKQSDNFTNLSSNDDYSERDVVGSYPADDPRSGWWLISIGCSFFHLCIGYPDIVVQQAAMGNGEDLETGDYIPPDEFSGLIIDIGEYELDRLIDVFAIVTAKPTNMEDGDFVEIDNICRSYKSNSVKTIQELLGDWMSKVSYLPERSFLEVATYSPGVYVYSVDPLLPRDIGNTVISIRRTDNFHYMYYFSNGILKREPPFRIDSDIHYSIMNY